MRDRASADPSSAVTRTVVPARFAAFAAAGTPLIALVTARSATSVAGPIRRPCIAVLLSCARRCCTDDRRPVPRGVAAALLVRHPFGVTSPAGREAKTGRVVFLTGCSSVGKTAIATAFREQRELEGRYWHLVGIDDVFSRLSWRWVDIGWRTGPGPFASSGLVIGDVDGQPRVRVGPLLRSLLRGYQAGTVAIADEGVDVLVDEVILDQVHFADWERVVGDRTVAWVDVRCDAEVVDRREAGRGDRPLGLARAQRSAVGASVDFDLVLDTTSTPPAENAERLARFLAV
jgi:chloramphenicol 3-O phosphotransferase